jgi:hypothetical protein
MTEYLIESTAKPAVHRVGAAFIVGLGLRLAVWALETLWHVSRR